MSKSDLPLWATWIQVVAVPLATITLSIFGSYLLWLQFQLQEIKLKADLYERRLRVYVAVKMFLAKIDVDATVTDESFGLFLLDTGDAEFLFGPEIGSLISLLAHKSYAFKNVIRKLNGVQTPEAHDASVKSENELCAWFKAQSDALPDAFRDYLHLPNKLQAVPRCFVKCWRWLFNVLAVWKTADAGKPQV